MTTHICWAWPFTWGSGAQVGSSQRQGARHLSRSIFNLWTNGNLSLNFGWLNGSGGAESFRDALKEALSAKLGWSIPADYAEKVGHRLPFDLGSHGTRVH